LITNYITSTNFN